MSVIVHVTMLFCMLLLPYPDSLSVIKTIAAPVMLIYPVASVILNLLLMRQQELRGFQEQIRQSEERFRILFDKAPLGYQSLDYEGHFIDVNQQWLDTLGYTREEVIGKWFGDFIAPDYREVFRQRFTLFKAKGRIHSEFEMLHKNGQKLFIAFEGKVGYGYDGTFKQTHCILQDITVQKAAEEKLLESEEKYRRLYETMAQGVIYQRADGKIISANPAAERILGISVHQLIDKTSMDPSWQSIAEDGSEIKGEDHPVMVALRTGKPVGPFIMGVYKPEIQDHIWLSINAIPLFHPGESTPYQAYATFQDITAERKAKQNYQQLFQEMVDAFAIHEIIINSDGKPVDYRFLAVNHAFENMTDLKAEDIVGKTVLEVMPGTEPYWIETYGKVALSGEPVRFENYSSVTGKHFMVSAYRSAPNQFACSFSDVTERFNAEKALIESKEKYSSYIKNAPDGIFVVDNNGTFIEVNKAATQITGYSEEELLTMKTDDITADEYMETSAQLFGSIFATGFASGELQFVHKDGSKKWMSIAAVRLSENRLLGFVSDITNKKAAEERLTYLSNHDFLTGIYNRRFFEEEIHRLNAQSELPLSIIIGDINGLKLINDSFGRTEGDRIIIETANLIQAYCRPGDVLARTGGDEFSILMPHTSCETAVELLYAIQAACRQYNSQLSNEAYHINLSLGASTKEMAEEDFTEVCKLAEDYMNQRKLLEKKSSHSSIISSIKATMLEKSHETEEHAERLSLLSRKIGLILHLSQIDLDHLELFATLHDIGKVGIADQIINKPGKLDEAEWVEMKKHPTIGYRIAMSAPNLVPIAEYILSHHERWDGSGYPQKLSGTDIPLLSRILSVVDAYDAITQDRPYRKAMTHEEAIEEIRKNAGTQFDPEIAKVFIENVIND